MSIWIYLFFLTIIHCQNLPDQSSAANVICSCDLNSNRCDQACCCDRDCSEKDLSAFQCDSKGKIQSSCFKSIPIYRSNSPHTIQKQGDLICINHEKSIPTEDILDKQINFTFVSRSMNADNSVSLPYGTPINLTTYQAGTSVYQYLNSTSTAYPYNLPASSFNNLMCSGSQSINYMNDFVSTCTQSVSQSTCVQQLDAATYTTNLCLITNPFTLISTANPPSFVCCNTTTSPPSSTWTGSACSNVLENFQLTIYYSNPTGITSCSYTVVASASSQTTVSQTFSIRYLRTGTTASTVTRSGNPGYLPASLLLTANNNGGSYTRTSGLAILQPGTCTTNSNKFIRFGENTQSTCLNTRCLNLADINTIFGLNSSSNMYVSIYGDPDAQTNPWKAILFCTSAVGSTDSPTCSSGSMTSLPSNQCFTRLDIQIIYSKIGSVTNPQPILGAVVYYFRSLSATLSISSYLITQTVTFQDDSKSPVTQDEQIPRPNTRLPGDFFYPFSLNHASRITIFSSIFYFLLFIIFFF